MRLAGKALRRGLGWWSGWFVVLVLSGCATAPGPISAGDASAKVNVPVAEAPAPTTVAAAPPIAAETPPLEGQPYLFALDPLRPSVIIESVDPSARTDLWVRVRSGFAMPDLDNALVLKWQQYYASRPDYVKRMTERGGRYLFYVVE